ncbi:1,4-alpha-glucan branching protein GlgB [Clostridium saccharobutylicum]|nr:1,4-alpha-glucan branching protein GlgB [Clostridium saccharobutylicum]MBC2415014.1 1,4-alpha-glucan branching protein GlgB [Clostridium saccharobutylicum]MBC2438783.1 1,4-alpha-glucan branching protein GlgB [Clostridium saccharobutylicum]MBC2442969.1 1,4-alpha-glucan branching protein GlgB [Clostridium saccharobutylicum]MBC2447209.1 1,4-alpha-glucan branching protein GlgB [Clostridium saccharobutylicum]
MDGTENEKDNKAVASKTKATRKTTSKSSTKTTKSVATKTTTRSRKNKSTTSSSKKSESSKDKTKVIAKDSLQVKTEQIKNKFDNVAKQVDKTDLTNFNTYLFHKGNNYESYNILGSHVKTENKHKGVQFATWAPNAMEVYVVGDFNEFEVRDEYKLEKITENGLWNGFFTRAKQGDKYKYCIVGQDGQMGEYKADPYAICTELRPGNASIIYEPENYKWNDKSWVDKRNKANVLEQPLNIYEMHLGSWKTNNEGGFLTYEEISEELPGYLKEMGYTHVEIMPLVEHPLDASWGYQGTGYYSPTSRYGKLEGLKILVDKLHEANIGVIMDWAPGHFCKDAHGLYKFDGSATYEYQEEWRAENKGWGTCNFDLGRCEVKSYLISNALYWFREFHVDGLRVDAVSSILYLDYSRKQGEWVPNKYGGNGSLEAIEFLKELNAAVFAEYPTALMIAEESTSWPNVTKPPVHDGLGFNLKWNMGWMNDTLEYIEIDPKYRKDNHRNITFAMMYNYAENYVLPLSHDEVVHGKKSLVEKMWGDEWNKFAGLRTFIGYMMGHPGKKLLFMGNEFAQRIEWREYESLQWNLINELEIHKQTQLFFKDLNHLYLNNKAFWELDHDYKGFNWIEADNSEQSVLIFARRSRNDDDTLIFIINFTSTVYYDYQIGVPFLGTYEELFNTDDSKYGGSGQVMGTELVAEKEGFQNQPYSLKIKVPPMATLILKIKEIENEKEFDELKIDE